MPLLNETHDPNSMSWVETANEQGSPFPLQNLPYAVFRSSGTDETFRIGVGIGDKILDLTALGRSESARTSRLNIPDSLYASTLNNFMAEGEAIWSSTRSTLFELLRQGSSYDGKVPDCLIEQSKAEYALPATIMDYTDFYASIDHATNIGKLFRPDNPLMPNYEWVPIAYHGRSSSIVVSGEPIVRPRGQIRPSIDAPPHVSVSEKLDYEMEVGLFVGMGNQRNVPVSIDEAEQHLFGVCLLNDWSARDIQAWEYQPLGPFLGKNFATTISPWIVTMEALAPFRTPMKEAEGRTILPYLNSDREEANCGIDMYLDVSIHSVKMKGDGLPPKRLGLSNFKYSYWTPAQMVAHHTVNGCNLRAGDLFGSGTMSGPGADQTGALIEVTQGGKLPVQISNTESRSFLEDGDTVFLSAWCERDGYRTIGFGECNGTIISAAEPVDSKEGG
ncbi:MAG: fumarylacetoacetase [Sneathiella sp.]|nr:fumarylacetoacetase [Sneathiella sp.]